MATLTETVPYRVEGGKKLLYIEVPVSAALEGPFLVSGARSPFLWVRKFPTNLIRAAVRKVPWEFLSREALECVAKKSSLEGWGNCGLPDAEGLRGALTHFEEYEIPKPYDFLHGSGFNLSILDGHSGLNPQEVNWVPAGWGVLLPGERAYLGSTFELGGGHRALVLHNASRGIGILRPEVEEESSRGEEE